MKPGDGSGPIQLNPPGLLALLQVKNSGKNPTVLLDSVSPTVDMGTWYMRSMQEYSQVVGNLPADGSGTLGVSISVPQGEWWFVHELGLEVRAGAADAAATCIFGLVMRPLSVSNALPITQWSQPLVGSATLRPFGFAVARGFWAPPGAPLFAEGHYTVGATNLTPIITATFTRLKI